MSASRLRRYTVASIVLAASAAAAVVVAAFWTPLVWFVFREYILLDPVTDIPPRPCADGGGDAAYCVEQYFDDGLIRLSAFWHSGRNNCCVVERLNVQRNSLSFRVLACTVDETIVLQCSRLQGVSASGYGHTIDGHSTYTDRNWPDHFSRFEVQVDD